MRNISRRQFIASTAAASTAYSLIPHTVLGANEQVNIGIIGLGWKGGEHLKHFPNVIAVSDPDEERMQKAEGAAKHKDMRALLDMKDIDAVVIATPNHWHCLAAIWAMQAGKHVYVEKPVSHYIWEGRQMCNAREKYNRVCQAGTQQLSCPAVIQCGEDIRSGKYGKVKWVHCFKINFRDSVGKRSTPLEIPANIDYNLWAGPAPMDPVYREKFHYDWHWDLRWGDGEMGNWVVHYTSDLCHMLGWNEMPDSVMSAGGRFLWDDAADAPNMLFSMMSYKGTPLTVEIRNLKNARENGMLPAYTGTREGNIIMCENAIIKIARGGGKAYSVDSAGNAGETITQYKGTGGHGHTNNFIEAIKSGDQAKLNAPVEGCHVSTGICHLSTASYRAGKQSSYDEIRSRMNEYEDIKNTVDEQLKQLDALQIDKSKLVLGPKLTFDPKAEKFTGDHAEEANKYIKLPSREAFTVPEVA